MTAVMMAKVCLKIFNVCVPSSAAQPFSSREVVFDTIVNTLSRYSVAHPEPLSWARSGDLALAEHRNASDEAHVPQPGPFGQDSRPSSLPLPCQFPPPTQLDLGTGPADLPLHEPFDEALAPLPRILGAIRVHVLPTDAASKCPACQSGDRVM